MSAGPARWATSSSRSTGSAASSPGSPPSAVRGRRWSCRTWGAAAGSPSSSSTAAAGPSTCCRFRRTPRATRTASRSAPGWPPEAGRRPKRTATTAGRSPTANSAGTVWRLVPGPPLAQDGACRPYIHLDLAASTPRRDVAGRAVDASARVFGVDGPWDVFMEAVGCRSAPPASRSTRTSARCTTGASTANPPKDGERGDAASWPAAGVLWPCAWLAGLAIQAGGVVCVDPNGSA